MAQCCSGPHGILCVCEDWKSNQSTKHYNDSTASHLATAGAIVEMKVVYFRPNCLNFLEELGKITSISVWSSMKILNVEDVVNYLFPKGKLPYLVLAQDSCTTLKCQDSSGRLTTFREHGPNRIGQKMMCNEQNHTEYNKVMEVVRGSGCTLN